MKYMNMIEYVHNGYDVHDVHVYMNMHTGIAFIGYCYTLSMKYVMVLRQHSTVVL